MHQVCGLPGEVNKVNAGGAKPVVGSRDRRSGGLADPSDSAFKVIRASDGKETNTIPIKSAGLGPGERQLNGVQTTGRDYRNLSEPAFGMRRTNDVEIEVRDGTVLMADLFPAGRGRPVSGARLSSRPTPRRIQDVGAPRLHRSRRFGLLSSCRGAGTPDRQRPRHRRVGQLLGVFDGQERDDLHDVVEWVAAQPWCDGNVGMLGISYFAMAQLAAAVTKPPEQFKAIAPLLPPTTSTRRRITTACSTPDFISAWLPAIGVMSRSPTPSGAAPGSTSPALSSVSRRSTRGCEHINGEAIVAVLKDVIRAHPPGTMTTSGVRSPSSTRCGTPSGTSGTSGRCSRPSTLSRRRLGQRAPAPAIDVRGVAGAPPKPNVRMALLPAGGFAWPWEALHVEVSLGTDHWLKGRDTRIMDGPPIRYQVPGAEGWRTAGDWPPAEATLTPSPSAPRGLESEEGEPGFREYLDFPAGSGVRGNANPPELPPSLAWETPVLKRPPWRSPATSSLCSRRRSPRSTRAGSPSSTTCHRRARRADHRRLAAQQAFVRGRGASVPLALRSSTAEEPAAGRRAGDLPARTRPKRTPRSSPPRASAGDRCRRQLGQVSDGARLHVPVREASRNAVFTPPGSCCRCSRRTGVIWPEAMKPRFNSKPASRGCLDGSGASVRVAPAFRQASSMSAA